MHKKYELIRSSFEVSCFVRLARLTRSKYLARLDSCTADFSFILTSMTAPWTEEEEVQAQCR